MAFHKHERLVFNWPNSQVATTMNLISNATSIIWFDHVWKDPFRWRAIYPLPLKFIKCYCLIKLVRLLRRGLKQRRSRGYSWFTHTQWGAQCKLQSWTCTNIYPGTFTFRPHRLHLIDTWSSISAASRHWIVFKVDLIRPSSGLMHCPPPLSP